MIPVRSLEPELLDEEHHDRGELAHSLSQVAQVNRWLGGTRALRRHLRPLLREAEGVRVLDVGTGNGETLDEVVRWARGRGRRWSGVGLERSRAVTEVAAARAEALLVRGDALRLPFADGSFHAVLCTLTLHHFDDDTGVGLLREMARVARRLVLVSDLERTPLNHLGARVLSATLWRGNRITRHDGPLSVLRSFTPSELLALARRAGLERAAVRRYFPWRLLLEARP